jgi:hypothetical protein
MQPTAGPQSAASATSTAAPAGAFPRSTTNDKRFLLLVINSKTVRVLSQPELPDTDDDQEFFNRIRQAYLEVRSSRRPVFRYGTPLLVQKAVEQLHRLSSAAQSLFIRVFAFLHLSWLVWWIGDIVFFIPTAANFVKVRSSMGSRSFFAFVALYPPHRLTDSSSSWCPSRRTSAQKF